MKKISQLVYLVVMSCSPLIAQNGAVSGFCNNGASQAIISGISSSNYNQGLVPFCSVFVYYSGTTNLAPIFNSVSDTATVSSVNITNGGTYSSCPTGVTFTGGGGSGAAALVSCTGSAITSVSVTNPGSGYATPPTVGFTGGSGSGGAATAVLVGTLTNPFTANSDASYLFYSLENQEIDINLRGGIFPNSYSNPRSIVGVYPPQGSNAVSGVTSINSTSGSFTFSGSGVSCIGTTCTFGSGGPFLPLSGGTMTGALLSSYTGTNNFSGPVSISSLYDTSLIRSACIITTS